MDAVTLLESVSKDFIFGDRPIPIPPDIRSDWRMANLCLMLDYCGRGGRASLKKLHLLNWASRTSQSRRAFLEKLRGILHPEDVAVRFDPAFNRAIDLARGENLVARDDTHAIQLTPNGEAWAKEIKKDKTCMAIEKQFFSTVGKSVTDNIVKQFLQPSSIW